MEIVPVEVKGGEDKSAPSCSGKRTENSVEIFKKRISERWKCHECAVVSGKENKRVDVKR